MANSKIKFCASSVEGKEGALCYQVTHKRVVRQVRTAYKVYPVEWNADRQCIEFPADVTPQRRRYLIAVQSALLADSALLRLAIIGLERERADYRADDVVRRFRRKEETSDLLDFAGTLIEEKKRQGRLRLAEKYRLALNSLVRFLGCRRLSFDAMCSTLMLEYEAHLKGRGLCPNTTSFYMRVLRAIYNQAVDRGLAVQCHPFKSVYTGVGKTVKRAVSVDAVRRLKQLDLSSHPSMELSRDLFLFSLYTRGMSFIDMAYLKKSDLHDGILAYRRKKTGQRLVVRWEKAMQDIVDKYDTAGSPYLLPIIRGAGTDEHRQCRNAIQLVDKYLKRIGRELGLGISLTTYVARHSWASIARSRRVPVSVISEALGHDSESTTQIYLASLDTSEIDHANREVLSVIDG